MVIDTSAVVAILFEEEDQRRYAEAIEGASIRLVSAVTRVELSFVVEGRKREAGRERLERFFALTDADVAAVTPQQATLAISAFRTFGKGRHPAGGHSVSGASMSATRMILRTLWNARWLNGASRQFERFARSRFRGASAVIDVFLCPASP